jgi:hypothetical protein
VTQLENFLSRYNSRFNPALKQPQTSLGHTTKGTWARHNLERVQYARTKLGQLSPYSATLEFWVLTKHAFTTHQTRVHQTRVT